MNRLIDIIKTNNSVIIEYYSIDQEKQIQQKEILIPYKTDHNTLSLSFEMSYEFLDDLLNKLKEML